MERLQVHLDEAALRANLATVRRLAGPTTPIMGVVKANAYGHGLIKTSELLVRHGVHHLAVADVEEACRLRDAGLAVPITILAPTSADAARAVVTGRLQASLSDLASARHLNRAAARYGSRAQVHVEIDTGLSRYGWSPTASGLAEIESLTRLGRLAVAGVFTHLSGGCPEELADQLRLFGNAYERVCAALGHRPVRHALASTALAACLRDHAPQTMIRPGALLYGVAPRCESVPAPAGLRPVLSLTSRVALLRSVPAGSAVGYEAAYRASRDALVALVPAGFGDGIPRQLAGIGRALVRTHEAPIIDVAMSHLAIDVTGIPGAGVGDIVTLIGSQGGHSIDVQEWASLTGAVNSDLLTGIAPTLPRAVSSAACAQGARSA